MLGEDLDIGFYAEDAYAAYVSDLATALHIAPAFRSARGATVEVHFTGPFLDAPAYQHAVDAGELEPFGEARGTARDLAGAAVVCVTLHGWVEKLNAARKVQLMEPLERADEPDEGLVAQLADTGGDAGASATPLHTSHFRVVGNLDFLLHLSSTRDMLMGESNPSNLDSPALTSDAATVIEEQRDAELDDATRAAHACRDALERRDDITLARNAVDAVIAFAQMAQEHPGETATVYVDAQNRAEYVQFGT